MVLVNIINRINNFATKTCGFWYFSLVENPVLHSESIRMEGMHFASKIEDFCVQTWMENSHKQS